MNILNAYLALNGLKRPIYRLNPSHLARCFAQMGTQLLLSCHVLHSSSYRTM
jgi:hypothetical protein